MSDKPRLVDAESRRVCEQADPHADVEAGDDLTVPLAVELAEAQARIAKLERTQARLREALASIAQSGGNVQTLYHAVNVARAALREQEGRQS